MSAADAAHPIRVLIVDDDFLVREAVKGILNAHADIEVVDAVGEGAAAVERARATHPDVVLIDIQMPGMDGAETTRAVLEHVRTEVVAMTSLATEEAVRRMLDAGAYGYVLKDSAPEALAEAVRTVARGDGYLSPHHTRLLIERAASASAVEAKQQAAALFATLSDRERDAARLVAAGATDAEIARAMHVALSTVKTHIQQARLKLGARNRTQIGVIVERAGETPPA